MIFSLGDGFGLKADLDLDILMQMLLFCTESNPTKFDYGRIVHKR